MNKNWADIVKMGQYQLKSRIVMTSLTRVRCDPKNGIPTDLLTKYYSQRAGCAFILTQASAWSPRGHSFPGAGNFYTKQQAQGWRKVIEAVHNKGTKIFLQIFHGGRSSHSKLNGGLQIWSASPIAIRDTNPILNQPYQIPKQMTLQDIKQTQLQFRNSVTMAKQIGFDGLQLHGAHGYLIDQFLKSQSNKRADKYGGSPQNRCRFTLQLIDIALQHFKPYQLGIKISPVSQYNDMFDKNPIETYTHLLKQLEKKNIGFVQIRQSTQFAPVGGKDYKLYYDKTPPQQIDNLCKTFRPSFNGIIIANDSFTPTRGLQFIRNGWADMISFGRLYINNPDLAQRIINNQQLNTKWDYSTFFSFANNPKGYTDYPFYNDKSETKI